MEMTLLMVLIIMGLLLFVNEITRGIVLISVYVVYLWILIRAQKENSKNNSKNRKNSEK